MKITTASIILSGLLLLVICYGFSGCQHSNPFNSRVTSACNNAFHAPILIEFIDAEQPYIMFPKNLTISISGPDKNLILSDLPKNNHKTLGNLLCLVLSPNAKPSVNDPITFTISAIGKHYELVSRTIVISNLTTHSYTIPMNYQ